jgi:hypothetical protein
VRASSPSPRPYRTQLLRAIGGDLFLLSQKVARAAADPERRASVKELALDLPKHAWRTITWREGTAETLGSRFARVRVRTAPIRGAA